MSCRVVTPRLHALSALAKRLKKVKSHAGRVTCDSIRHVDLKTRIPGFSEHLLKQEKHSKQKLYRLYAPEMECIAKGKTHKRYALGCKVSVVTTCKDPWVLSNSAHPDNAYGGATLKSSFTKAEEHSQAKIESAFADKAYRDKDHYPDSGKVFISVTKKLPALFSKILKSRSAIEPMIGHLKNAHRLGRNYLLGKISDQVNAILSNYAF